MNWKQFWGICEHRWRTINTQNIIQRNWRTDREMVIGISRTLECEKCGDLKDFTVNV